MTIQSCWIMIFLILFASCSKPSQNTELKQLKQTQDIEFSALNVSALPDGSFLDSNMDFASLTFKQSATQELVIFNPNPQSISYASADFNFEDLSPFQLVSNGCLINLASRQKCVIKFKLVNSSSLPEDLSLSNTISIKDSTIVLSGILQQDLTDYSAPSPEISIAPLFLDFGTMTQGKTKELSVIISNNSDQEQSTARDSFSTTRASVSSTTCPIMLPPRKSCSLKILFSADVVESASAMSLVKIANHQLTYSVSVNNNPIINSSIQPAVASSSITLMPPAQNSGTIVFTNNSITTFTGPVSAESSSPAIMINSISCASGLSRNKQCSVSYNINSSLFSSGQSNHTIKLKSGNNISVSFGLSLNIQQTSLPCTAIAATANGVSLINSNSSIQGNIIDGDVSQCFLAETACNEFYNRNISGKSCDAIITACTPSDATANGVSFLNSNSTVKGNVVAGNKTACLLADAACSEYHLRNVSGKSCDFESVACSLQNADDFNVNLNNVSTVSGMTPNCIVSACSVSTHEPTPLIGANSCQEKKVLSSSFSFVSAYSSSLTNSVIATATNASQILVYSGDDCLTTPIEYTLPLDMIVSPLQADGVIRYSAKFKNINNLSSCINASYIYDTVVVGNLLANNLDSAAKSSIIPQNISISSNGSDIVFTKSAVTSDANCSSVDLSGRPEIAIGASQSISPMLNVLSRLCAIGRDLTGNWQSTPSDLGTMMADTSPPSSIATFTHATFFNSTTQTPVLTWSASSDLLSGLNRYEISVGSTPGAVNIVNWQSVGLVTSIQLNAILTSYSNQTVYAQIRAVDNVGNLSPAKISSGWYVGEPTINLSIASPTASDKIKISNASAFEVRGSCSEIGRNVSVKVGSLAAQTVACAGVSPNGTYSKVINTTSLANGNIVIDVTHDNSFFISRTVSITIQKDTMAPTVGFTSPANSSSYALPGNSAFNISGSCSEANLPVKISSSYDFEIDVNCSVSNTFQFSVDLENQTVTSITFFATQTDAVGNIAQEVSLNLTNGNFTRLLTDSLSKTEQPIHGISTTLGDGSLGKVIHLVNARNDAEAALAISNVDGSEFTVLTNQVGNGAVSAFNSLQGENNDRLGVYSSLNESIYFRQRIPNTNAIGLYAVGIDGSNYRQILGANSSHPDSEVIQILIGGPQNDKLIFIADKETNDDYELYVSDLNGNSIVKLSDTLADGGDITGVWMNTNSNRVVYFGDQDADFKFDLYSVQLSGANRVKLTPTPQAYTDGQDRRPGVYVLTSDDQYVVYSYDYKLDEIYTVFSAKLDGSTPPVALQSLDVSAEISSTNRFEVSPDQTKVAYVADDFNGVLDSSGQGNGVYHAFTVNIDGTNIMRVSRNLTSNRDVSVARWSPDSQYIYWWGDQGLADNQFNFFKAKARIPYTDTVNSGFVQMTNFAAYTTPSSYIVSIGPTYFPNQKDTPASTAFRISLDGSKLIFVCDLTNETIISHDLCSLDTSANMVTSSTIIRGPSTNPASNIIGLIFPTTIGDNRLIYVLDPDVDGKHEAFIGSVSGGSETKMSSPITYSAGAVTGTRDYFSVDWTNERILYSLNDINANKYGFSSNFAGSDHVKIGSPIVVSDVNTSFVINNRVVFLSDVNVANKAELFSTSLDGTDLKKLNAPIGNNGTISSFIQIGTSNNIMYVVAPSDTQSAQLHVVDISNPASDINLTPNFQIDAEINSWTISIDGQYVVFVSDANNDEVDDIFAAKLDGTRLVQLNPSGWNGAGDVTTFAIAPNSRTVAITADSRIDTKPEYYLSNIDTPSWINITTGIQVASQGTKDSTSLQVTGAAVFNASSSRVCYMGDLFINGDTDLYCTDTNGLGALQVASIGASETVIFMNLVSLSTDPTFTKVIFRADVEVDNQTAIYSMNFDMTGTVKLTADLGNTIYTATQNTAIYDAYNQASTKMIFRADLEVSNKFELYSVNLDGTSLVKLNQALGNQNDVHSYYIANNSVVYLADVGSIPRRVYSYNLTTSTRTSLTNFSLAQGQAFSYNRPDITTKHYWGPNVASNWVAVFANGNSANVIDCYLTRMDGVGGLKKISPNLAPFSFGCNSVKTSPTIDKAYFQADTQSFGIVDLFLQSLTP